MWMFVNISVCRKIDGIQCQILGRILSMCLRKPNINLCYYLNCTPNWTPGPAIPSLCRSWSGEAGFYFHQESLIEYDREKMRVWGRWRLQTLPNNQQDASYQPVSPSCACYLISYILFVNFTGMKVCGLINLTLTMREISESVVLPPLVSMRY